MSKRKAVIISLILILAAVGITIAATLGYYTDRKGQSVVLHAANLDYTLTARINGSEEFNNYSSSNSDIRYTEFTIENNSDNSTMAEIGLNTTFMFDKTANYNEILFYPEAVSDAEIYTEIANNTFSKNCPIEDNAVLFDKVTVSAKSTKTFKVKVVNKSNYNAGNVLKLDVFAKVFTGNASGGYGFLDNMQDTSGLYYFYNLNTSKNTINQGVQTITSDDIKYSSSTTYTSSTPLVNLSELGVIENNITFYDYEGKLSDYGLTLNNGKIYGKPRNMPESYEIRFRYSTGNKSWVEKSTRTDGIYIGKIILNFKQNGIAITDTNIADIPNQTYNGSEIKPGVTITYDGDILVEGTDYNISYSNNTNAGTATVTIEGIGNYNGTATKNFTIDKAASGISALPSAKNLTYNGEQQNLINAGIATGGTVYYKLNSYIDNNSNKTDYNESYSTSIPVRTEAGTYKVDYYVKGDDNHNDSAVSHIDIVISRASYTATVSMSDYVYAGTKATPSVSYNPGGGTVTYYSRSTSTGTATNWSNVTSTTYNAGTRYIYAYIASTNNYNACTTSNTSFNISKASFTANVSISGYIYGGTKSTPSVTSNPGGGSVTYYGRSTATGTSTNWSNVTNTTYDSGTRYIYATIAESTNYLGCTTGNTSFSITKANSSVSTAPSANSLSYTGSAQTLTTTGTASGGTMYYRLYQYKSTTASSYTTYSNSYSTTRPTGTAAGTYIVQYYVKGDSNHNDTSVSTVTVTIGKAAASVSTAPSANSLTYSGSAQTLTTTGTTSGGTMYYRLYQFKSTTASSYTTYSNSYSTTRPTGTAAGTYIVQYYVLGDSNHNDTSASTVTVTISKASFTATVSISGYTYAGTKSTPSVSNNPGGGTVTYYGRSTSTGTATGWSSVTSTTYDAGTRYIYATIAATANYNSYTTANTNFTISKASQSAPTSLTSSVSGTTVTLTASGSGKTALQYSKDGSTWQSSNVFSNCSGTITFYARYASTTNYNASSSKTISVSLRSGLWTDYAATSFAGGSGTSSSPYLIATAEQLARVVTTNSTQSAYYYKLTADIDLSAHYWVPIGEKSNTDYFCGGFDGDGHSITGMEVDTSNSYQNIGLFGEVALAGTYIKNLSLVSPVVKTTSNIPTGALCGQLRISTKNKTGNVYGIYIQDENIESVGQTGSIAGELYGYNSTSTIHNIYDVYINGGTIKATNYVGGIIGYTQQGKNTIYNSNVILSSLEGTDVGGIVCGNSSVNNCTVNINSIISINDTASGINGKMYSNKEIKTCVVNHLGDLNTNEFISGLFVLGYQNNTYHSSNMNTTYFNNNYYNATKDQYVIGFNDNNCSSFSGVTKKSFTTTNIKSIINTLGSSEWGTDGTYIYYKSSTLTAHKSLVTLSRVELLNEEVIEKINSEGISVDISTPESEELPGIGLPTPSVQDNPQQEDVLPTPSVETIPNIHDYVRDESIPSPTPSPTQIPISKDADDMDGYISVPSPSVPYIPDKNEENIAPNDVHDEITNNSPQLICEQDDKSQNTEGEQDVKESDDADSSKDLGSNDINNMIMEVTAPELNKSVENTGSTDTSSETSSDNTSSDSSKEVNIAKNSDSSNESNDLKNSKIFDAVSASATLHNDSDVWSKSLTESLLALANIAETVKGGVSDGIDYNLRNSICLRGICSNDNR